MHASQSQTLLINMKNLFISSISFFLLILCTSTVPVYDDEYEDFLGCLSQEFQNFSISNNVYTMNNSSYSSILQFSIRNLRFSTESTPKPQVIITPEHESQIPPLIYCAKQTGLEIRTRSGGHDTEGLSYVSQLPFLIIDLINLSEITVNVDDKTAWIQAGATIGSLYYKIAEKSPLLGFPAGFCATVGVGGHFSGGGYGTMLRKYGLAADNVIDARIVDVNGKILDRKSMGEDLFWAIRGGGGCQFRCNCCLEGTISGRSRNSHCFLRCKAIPSSTRSSLARCGSKTGQRFVHRNLFLPDEFQPGRQEYYS